MQGNGIVFPAQQQPTPAISEYPRYLYTAELPDLSPGTTYYLVAGDKSNDNSFSTEIKFRTIPMTGDFSFVAGGDAGGSDTTREVRSYNKQKFRSVDVDLISRSDVQNSGIVRTLFCCFWR